MVNSKKIMYRLKVFVAILWGTLICSTLLFLLAYLSQHTFAEGKNELQHFIENANENMIFVYLGLYALRGILFLPSSLMVLLSGAIFPLKEAFFLALIGQMLSSVLLYGVAKFVGREFFVQLEDKSEIIARFDETFTKKGFFATLILSTIPIVPADTVSVIAAITGISFSDYFAGMFLGSIAFILPFMFLGESLHSSKGILITIGLFFLLLALTVWAWNHPHFRHLFRKSKK